MKKLIKNSKKGVAIELSIVALVVVFAISSLLVSISVMANSVGNRAINDFKEKTELSNQANSNSFNDDGIYDFITADGTLKLTVEVKNGKITKWTYSQKEN